MTPHQPVRSYAIMRTLFIFTLSLILFSCNTETNNDSAKKNLTSVAKDCDPAVPDHAPGYPDPYENLEKGDWSFMGPYDWGSRVISMAVDPTNPYRLYAGSASGGLWLNEDTRTDGWKWVNTGSHKIMGVSSIAIHQKDPNIIFIGTGEVYNYENSTGGYDMHKTRGSYGTGVYYSKDKGMTWTQATGFPDINTIGIQDIEIVEENEKIHVWAATTEGVYHSEGFGNFEPSLKKIMVTDLSVHPTKPNQVVAAVGNLNTPEAGIYYSEDGGKNWARKWTREPSPYMGKCKLDRFDGNPDIVYAVTGSWSPLYFYNNLEGEKKLKNGDCEWPDAGYPKTTYNAIYHSSDGGKSWEEKYNGKAWSGGQGHYSLNVTVDPKTNSTVWLAGISPIYYSDDSGKTVKTKSSRGSSALNNDCLYEAMGYFDAHVIHFVPEVEGLVYICSDQGVYMSTNNMKKVKRINRNLAIMQFYPQMAYTDKDPNIMFACAQDYGPGCLSYRGINEETGRSSWELLYGYGHEAGQCLYDDENDIAYMSIHMGSMIARRHIKSDAVIDPPDTVAANGAFHYMSDFSPFDRGPMCYKHSSWNAPLAFSKSNPNKIYTAKDIVYSSVKGPNDLAAGKVWEATEPNGTGLDGNIIHQMVVDPKSDQNLFIATAPRYGPMHVYSSMDGGKTWNNIGTENFPKKRNPSSLTMHPSKPNKLYMTFDGFGQASAWKGEQINGIWEWTEIDNNLPDDAFTRAIAVDPSNPTHLFVATDYGVYKSPDDGSSWQLYSSGLPPAIEGVQLIVYDAQRKLRLVSHGNGLWERSI